MNEQSGASAGSGIGLATIVTLVFVVLKLCNVIAWSWWWVLSPLWIVTALVILFITVLVIVASRS